MGFPSPPTDYEESRISLDEVCGTRRAVTYLFRADFTSWREGIKKEAIIIVDFSRKSIDGSIVACIIDNQFRTKRFRTLPQPHLEDLDHPERKTKLPDLDDTGLEICIKGVVTHFVNDARSGEFDNCPVM
ncbi:MAG TPA: S24 family peptidase [Scandinavium sp.]|jgi:DNA polymerase V